MGLFFDFLGRPDDPRERTAVAGLNVGQNTATFVNPFSQKYSTFPNFGFVA
jgi:hypothetical protein